MEREATQIISEIAERFGIIRTLSEWKNISSAESLEDINFILDKRDAVLGEISALRERFNSLYPCELISNHPDYQAMVAEVGEIEKADSFLMEKIGEQMATIKGKIFSSNTFRNKALPSYLRQKSALALKLVG